MTSSCLQFIYLLHTSWDILPDKDELEDAAHRNQIVVMMPTLSQLAPMELVMKTDSDAACDDIDRQISAPNARSVFIFLVLPDTLQCRHNGRDGISNHQPHDCFLNRLIRCRSNKMPKVRVIGLCAGIQRTPVNSPHKAPVTRKMFPFDDVIMEHGFCFQTSCAMSKSRANAKMAGPVSWKMENWPASARQNTPDLVVPLKPGQVQSLKPDSCHHTDVLMSAVASQITSLTFV